MQLYSLKFPNGKMYIGITSKTAEKRFVRHCAPSENKNPCQNAIHKYGKENITISVLGECDDWELLCLAEMEAIEKFNTFKPNGYNLTLGGEGGAVVNVFGDERKKRDKSLTYRTTKAWRDANRDSVRAYQKAYREANRVVVTDDSGCCDIDDKKRAIKESSKAYYKANKDKVAAACKSYYETNKEYLLAKRKASYKAKKLAIANRNDRLNRKLTQ
jgi:group I intron endonuclease